MMQKLIKKSVQSLGYEIRRVKPEDPASVHFLHIGKNAGTQIARLIKQFNDLSGDRRIVKHPHSIKLKDLAGRGDYFFSIRNPISRFYSGFYSRKRKGAPRIYAEWTPYEAHSFNNFEHANDLAEALFQDGELGFRAQSAMYSLVHAASSQWSWFQACGAFLEIRPPLAIIRQEHFREDTQAFFTRIGMPNCFDVLKIASDSVKSHRNDYTATPELSAKARANLERWYAQDIEFYAMCEHWMKQTTA